MRVQNSQSGPETDRPSDSPSAMNTASSVLRGALDRLAAALAGPGSGRARSDGAGDSGELEPVLYLQWRSALSDESGQTFLATAKSGAIVIYEGTPQKPGSLIWSSAPEESAASIPAQPSVTPAPAQAQAAAQSHGTAPSAEPTGTQEVFITSRSSGKRLAVDVTSTGSRGRLILQAANGGAHQRFLATVHEGKYLLRAAQPTFIINAAQGTKGQGWQLIEVPAPDSEDQGLTIEETAEGDYRIRAPRSGRWLAAAQAHGGEVPVLDASQGREPASRWLIHAAPPIPRLCALDLASVAPRPKTDGALDVVIASGQVPCVDALAGTAFRVFSGDFLKRGRDQLLVVRPANKHHHVDLLELGSAGGGSASVLRSDLLEPGSWLDGWLGPNDLQLVGDLAGHGASQLLLLHRGQRRPGEQAVLLSLQNGCAEPRKLYADSWGEANWLDGWLDPNDAHLVGDFMGLGHDQWLMMNRNPRGGKIRIVDIKGGSPRRCYTEVWGQSPLLDGWMGEGCVMLSGDFLKRGHQQLLFINRDISINTGKVLIVDFCRPSPPAEVCYREMWGQSDLLNDFLGESDVAVAGDFMGVGYSQVLFVGRKGEGEKFLVADFHGGSPPLAACVREPWGQRARHESLIRPGSVVLAGQFRRPSEGQAPSAQVVLL